MYFLDTNTCIYFLNGIYRSIRDRILRLPPAELAIPSVVKAELLLGAYNSLKPAENTDKVERFLEPFEIVPFTDAVTYTYAALRSKAEREGIVIGPNDLFIASIVVFHKGILVTNNVKEFRRIPELNVENWVE